MSPEIWRERIEHILAAIAEIKIFIGAMNREEFLADAKTLKAVTSNLTIIGEAARHIPDDVTNLHPEIPWALMRGMRNRIVHGYFNVDAVVVWDTCQTDLEPIVVQLQSLVEESP